MSRASLHLDAKPAAMNRGPAEPLREVHALPLCVDLDGTLLKNDSLHEAMVFIGLQRWRNVLQMPLWLLKGRANLKREIGLRWSFDPAQLPYNEGVLAYLRKQRADGRAIILTTAADEKVAQRIAAHLRLFDEVIASDGMTNLRGPTKASALSRRFGKGGFIYAGNDAPDLHVWEAAAGAVIVNGSAALKRESERRFRVEQVIDEHDGPYKPAIRALRPFQWIKNLLVFVPLLLAGDLQNFTAWQSTFAMMAAFCAVASAIYLLNDMGDLAADRAHPRKRSRPFASGELSVMTGLLIIPPLVALGLGLGIWSGGWPSLVLYAALSFAYTMRLKELLLVDVFVLTALYTVRLYGGSEASGYAVSLWLLGFSLFLFLSLALIKRVSELSRLELASQEKTERRGYIVQDLPILQMLGISSTFASAVVLSLYIQSEMASDLYQRPTILWGLLPLLLFWQCRLWLSTARGSMHDDPLVYAARDPISWCVFLGVAALMFAAKFPW